MLYICVSAFILGVMHGTAHCYDSYHANRLDVMSYLLYGYMNVIQRLYGILFQTIETRASQNTGYV